jgi:hypothetical protein
MNYKELWAQARALAFEEPVDMDGPLEGLKGFNQQVYEKFAELIVRECAQFVEDKFDFCGDKIIIAEEVRKHFGVEL